VIPDVYARRYAVRPTFHHRPVNGPFEDPSVYVRILRERKAFLFDAGDMSGLSPREIMKISDVFVTHTHIDHFIGFDTILRTVLRREEPVSFFGPEGIIGHIEGKLAGYTWNLISDYPVTVQVAEIMGDTVRRAVFSAANRFRLVEMEAEDFRGILVDSPLYEVAAVILEHGVPTAGYYMREKMHINIDRARLTERGLSVGQWLSGFKDKIRNSLYDDVIDTGSGRYAVSELNDIYRITEGQKVSYIMDSSPSEENIEKIVEFVRGSDSLYIEAYFSHEEIDRARSRDHLTARIAGTIARRAEVKNLHLLHFSPRYSDSPERLLREAYEAFTH